MPELPVRVVRGLATALAVIAAALVFAVMVMIAADVVRRNLTGRGLPGVVEHTEVLMVGFIFLGLAYAQVREAHIGVVALTRLLPPRPAQGLRALGLVAAVGILAWMAWRTGLAAERAWRAGEFRYGLVQVPIWPARVAIPIGLTAFALQLAVDLAAAVRGLVRGTPPPLPGEDDVRSIA